MVKAMAAVGALVVGCGGGPGPGSPQPPSSPPAAMPAAVVVDTDAAAQPPAAPALAPPQAAGAEAAAATAATPTEPAEAPPPPAARYACPMHPQHVYPAAGQCPICGMDLIELPPPSNGADRPPPAKSNTHPSHGHPGSKRRRGCRTITNWYDEYTRCPATTR